MKKPTVAKLKKVLDALVRKMKYQKKTKCDRSDEGDCRGRLTVEHALYYAGKKIQDCFALITLCEFHHGVEHYANCYGQNKKRHQEIALSQATEADRKKYPLLPWHLLHNKH